MLSYVKWFALQEADMERETKKEEKVFEISMLLDFYGEILTEKAGHLNLGIPGIMCMGGAGGCLMLNLIGNPDFRVFSSFFWAFLLRLFLPFF